ncbi:MAG: hypothetical protein AAGA40_02730 [Cyanobacteria bacterium P01_E01_bin.45]
MALNDRQLQALKTRVHQQAQALADSEALAMQNMQYAAELEQQLNSCQVMLTSQEAVAAEVESLKAQLASSQQQGQQVEHLEQKLSQLEADRVRLQQDVDTARQRCQQLETSATKVAKLQSIAATLRDERDELVQRLEQAKTSVTAAQTQTDAVQQLQQQVHKVAEERDVLARRLEQTQAEFLASMEGEPSEQVKEAQRRQEVAEAHHYVLKRQYETLQERVKELEQECAQAHSHSQECDRDLAELERTKLDLEDRIDQLQARNQTLQFCVDELQASTVTANHLATSTVQPSSFQSSMTVSGSPEEASLPSMSNANSQPDNTKQVLQNELAALRAENQALQERLDLQQPAPPAEPVPTPTFERPSIQSPLPPELFPGQRLTAQYGASSDSLLPSIPPLDLTSRPGGGDRKFDRRVLNLAAASAESVASPASDSDDGMRPRTHEVTLPSFVSGR